MAKYRVRFKRILNQVGFGTIEAANPKEAAEVAEEWAGQLGGDPATEWQGEVTEEGIDHYVGKAEADG